MFARAAKSIRNNILIGLILVTPIVVTGFLVNWLFNFTTNRLIPTSMQQSEYAVLFRAGALLLVFVILFLVGLLVRNMLGKRLYQLGDLFLTRIPVINKIYLSVRQISEALVSQQQTMFKRVVLVEYPRRGAYSMAFVTSRIPPNLRDRLTDNENEAWSSLFIPTTPNPTSGVLLFVPTESLVELPITVADAMKLIISGGAAYPGTASPEREPTLLEKLEAMLREKSSTDEPEEEPGEAHHV